MRYRWPEWCYLPPEAPFITLGSTSAERFVLALFEAPLSWMHGTLGDAHDPARIGKMLLRYTLLVGGEIFFLQNHARKPQGPGEDPFSLLWLQGEHQTHTRVSVARHWATATINALMSKYTEEHYREASSRTELENSLKASSKHSLLFLLL